MFWEFKKNMTISEKILEIRQSTGLSATAFAKALDYPQRTYASYEAGDRKPPIEFLTLLIEKYNINANWLLLGIGNKYLPDNYAEKTIKEKMLQTKNTLGAKINYLILDSHLSYEKAGELLNISKNKIEKIIVDKEVPSLDLLKAIAQNFSVSVDSLLGINNNNEVNTLLIKNKIFELLATGMSVDNIASVLKIHKEVITQTIASVLPKSSNI